MMKKLLMVSLMMGVVGGSFAATLQGNEKGNGGDLCENRIQNVATDIEKWLIKNEFEGLTLPDGLSLNDYKEGMLQAIKETKVDCTDEKLFVGNAEKTCKNFLNSDNVPQLRCNVRRIKGTDEKEIYRLAHHEFAGVAGFETNANERSKYVISNQISKYLHEELVYKLGIKQEGSKECGRSGAVGERINSCNKLKGVFALVSKTKEGVEIWKDLKSGLVWGDVLSLKMNRYAAEVTCTERVSELNLDYKLRWRLPDIEEYHIASAHDFQKVLTPMKKTPLWTSSRSLHTNVAWVYSIVDIDTERAKDNEKHFVRCVAEDK